MKEILNSKTQNFTCKGTGKTEKEAYDMCFANMRKQAVDMSDELYIVHVVPTSVVQSKYNVEEYTEKFMFFFWPKKRTTYEIEIEINADIKYLG